MRLNKIKLVIAVILFLNIIACESKENIKNEDIRPVKIEKIKINEDKFATITFPAQVLASNKTFLSFKVAGTIKEIKGDVGDFVKSGDEIVIMDTQDYDLKLNAIKQKYEAAKAMVINVKEQFSRAKKMYEGEALAKKDYDNIVAKRDIALANFNEAKIGLQNAKNTLKDTKLVAPYDGYIDKKIEDVGTVVGAGKPVIYFVSNDRPNVSINISSNEIEKLKNVKNIIFKKNNSTNFYEMEIRSIGKNPDLTKLTYPVILNFKEDNLDKDILIGDTGDIILTYQNTEKKDITIPLSSIFEDNGENVYLFENGIAVKRKIKIGSLYQKDRVVVLEGLKAGDNVIIAGVPNIFDGKKIKLLEDNNEDF